MVMNDLMIIVTFQPIKAIWRNKKADIKESKSLPSISSSSLSGSHRAATVTALDAGVGTVLQSLQRLNFKPFLVL